MEPRIQYAQTADGVSIAVYTLGQGMPLMLANPWTHLHEEWQVPELRRWFERLAKGRRLVRYDHRGCGLSERDITDFSLETQLLDLEAVVDGLGLERFALVAYADAGPAAIAYAARNPERVSHLVLKGTWARGSTQGPEIHALMALLDRDWRLFMESLVLTVYGWSGGDRASRWVELYLQSTTPEAVKAAWSASFEYDVTALLPQVRSPTLVLHPSQIRFMSLDEAKDLASRIPNARLAVLPGVPSTQWWDESGELEQAIDEFLGEGEEATAAAELPEGMAVLLFADIAESTALTEQLGDAAFRAKARELDSSLRLVIREAGGTPVEGKVLGDGVLAVFTSARQAIDCALRCEATGEPLGLQLHLGIHAGDVIREGNNVYGGAVNIAARIAAASAPGEVLVSDTVRGLGRTSANVTFDDRGEHELKGVGEPQRLFAVRGGG